MRTVSFRVPYQQNGLIQLSLFYYFIGHTLKMKNRPRNQGRWYKSKFVPHFIMPQYIEFFRKAKILSLHSLTMTLGLILESHFLVCDFCPPYAVWLSFMTFVKIGDSLGGWTVYVSADIHHVIPSVVAVHQRKIFPIQLIRPDRKTR